MRRQRLQHIELEGKGLRRGQRDRGPVRDGAQRGDATDRSFANWADAIDSRQQEVGRQLQELRRMFAPGRPCHRPKGLVGSLRRGGCREDLCRQQQQSSYWSLQCPRLRYQNGRVVPRVSLRHGQIARRRPPKPGLGQPCGWRAPNAAAVLALTVACDAPAASIALEAVDDELNILPISSHAKDIRPIGSGEDPALDARTRGGAAEGSGGASDETPTRLPPMVVALCSPSNTRRERLCAPYSGSISQANHAPDSRLRNRQGRPSLEAFRPAGECRGCAGCVSSGCIRSARASRCQRRSAGMDHLLISALTLVQIVLIV